MTETLEQKASKQKFSGNSMLDKHNLLMEYASGKLNCPAGEIGRRLHEIDEHYTPRDIKIIRGIAYGIKLLFAPLYGPAIRF